ncbi:MAG: winged helix DNA-binding domain-containing protein, partial [Mycobacteriaceae bacterium]|nr:winged helix DNA-binding domain-containing protein [Mycobacteriaceae bacterium]
AELVRHWLAAFGPGTLADLKWWTGWTLTAARAALADVGAVEVGLAEGTGHLLPDDLEPVVAEQHWVALLPALDPTPMGWQQREWYLGAHKAAVFDRTGNVGPTVWCDGRIVGGWAQRPDGDIAVRLVEDVGSDARREIDTAAANLGSWLGEVRLSARGRGRTPLESELSS